MKLGESGEAFFVEELENSDDLEIPDNLVTSPIPVLELENLFNQVWNINSFIKYTCPIFEALINEKVFELFS